MGRPGASGPLAGQQEARPPVAARPGSPGARPARIRSIDCRCPGVIERLLWSEPGRLRGALAMRRLLRALLLAGLVLALLLAGVWVSLRPPALEVPSQRRLVLSNVTVVSPGLGRSEGRTLTVAGGRIESIASTDPDALPSGERAAFSGSYVLPGLIDMHVHYDAWVGDTEYFGLLFLAHGVTAVRDTGDLFGTMLRRKRQVREGAYPGPRIYSCGPVLDGDPPIWPALLPGSWVVRTAEEARSAVAELARRRVDCVKVYSLLSAEALAAIRREAARYGLPVIGHVPLAVAFEDAYLRDVQHLTGVPRIGEHEDVTWQSYGSVVAAAWRALDAERVDFVVRTSLEQGIVHTPTLVVFSQLSRERGRLRLPGGSSGILMPPLFRDVVWKQQGMLQALADLSEPAGQMRAVVGRLHAAGVRVLAGTDTPNPFVVPGASLHEELRYFVEAGFTPEQAWLAASRWAGESLGEPGLGTLRAGAPADLLVFREDPTRDLAALSTLEAVVAQGRLYPKAWLDRAIRRYRAYFDGRLYAGISTLLGHVVSWVPGTGAENASGPPPAATARYRPGAASAAARPLVTTSWTSNSTRSRQCSIHSSSTPGRPTP